jgi:hypothetical protein
MIREVRFVRIIQAANLSIENHRPDLQLSQKSFVQSPKGLEVISLSGDPPALPLLAPGERVKAVELNLEGDGLDVRRAQEHARCAAPPEQDTPWPSLRSAGPERKDLGEIRTPANEC